MSTFLSRIFGYLMMFLHIIFFVTAVIGPYITNNFYYLSILILFYVVMYANWYIFGSCVLSRFEQGLTGQEIKTEDGHQESFIMKLIEDIIQNKNIADNMVIYLPFINTIVVLWKMNKLFYSKFKFSYHL